jgi:hypothetical protein
VSFSGEEHELILQLFDDATLLERKVAYELPAPAELRATFAPILRRWIVDGAFHRLQKLLREKIQFEIYSRTDEVKYCQAGVYTWWMGAIECGQQRIGASQFAQKYLDNPDDRPDPRKPFLIKQKARLFFEQPCFLWKKQLYTRHDMIKFQANKLGGAHYDFNRNKKETHVEEIQNQFGLAFEDAGKARMLVPGEIVALRADPNTRDRVFDAIQLTVGATASIFCKGVRSYESQIRGLLL